MADEDIGIATERGSVVVKILAVWSAPTLNQCSSQTAAPPASAIRS